MISSLQYFTRYDHASSSTYTISTSTTSSDRFAARALASWCRSYNREYTHGWKRITFSSARVER